MKIKHLPFSLSLGLVLALILLRLFGGWNAPAPAAAAIPTGTDELMDVAVAQPVTSTQLYLPLVMHNWPPPSWHFQYVDSRRLFEDMSPRSLALDSAGNPHVAFGYDVLYHAWRDGGVWQFEVVDDSPWVGKYASLALDSNDYAHIGYYDWDKYCLKYARWDGDSWEIETVDCEGGWDISLALDDDDHPHISFSDPVGFSRQDLKYAHWDGLGWTVETVEAGSDSRVGGDNSLALDSLGRPHISYNDSGPGSDPYSIKHAFRDGGTWITETLETGGHVGSNSIALDGSDHIHIMYRFTDTSRYIKYAYWNGTTWQTQAILDHSDDLYGLSLVVDGADNPHFSYYRDEGGRTRSLQYTYWGGGTWQTEQADSGLEGFHQMENTSLQLDASGAPHIAYYIEEQTLLKYAHNDGVPLQQSFDLTQDNASSSVPSQANAWSAETIEKGGEMGIYASLGLDGDDDPHIAYYEDRGEDLIYAHWDGGGWQIVTVDTDGSGHTDGSVSLAVDSLGNPHISYRFDKGTFQEGDQGLKYAWWDGSWQTQVIDTEGRAGRGSSIAIDSNGRPHISYYYIGSGEDALRYAYWDGANWQIDTVDPVRQKYIDSPTSLALDGDNHPHIAYFDGDTDDLNYAYWDGGAWQVETVDSAGDVGVYPSLELDGSGYPHISYRDWDNDDLKYAYWDGTQWNLQTVDDWDDLGYHTSLELDNNDHPHISYYDNTEDDLKYAYWDGSQWQIEAVDSEGDVGYFSSLVLDNADRPHIAYQDHGGSDLKYAWLGQ